MKIIKSINNNVAVCLDSKGTECIVTGKGVGFGKISSDVPLKKIERVYYNVNPIYMDYIRNLKPEILDIATEIVDYANFKYENRYDSNVVFSLADHIEFILKRKSEGLRVDLPLYYDIRKLHPNEIKLGIVAVDLINEELDTNIDKDESAGIALHFINYDKRNYQSKKQKIIEDCTLVIEQYFDISIDREGLNYSRFVTHLYYLLDRNDKAIKLNNNGDLFNILKEKYPKIYECSLLLKERIDKNLGNDELTYLMIHINRLYTREDCYQ